MNFIDEFRKNTQISNFMKIRSVVVELFHADGQTDGRTEIERERERKGDRQTDVLKLIVASRSFANALEKRKYHLLVCSFPILKHFSLLHHCNSAGLDR